MTCCNQPGRLAVYNGFKNTQLAAVKLILLSLFLFPASVQQEDLIRVVLYRYSNGEEKLVVWCKPSSNEIVKEEGFFETGARDYIGYYRNDLEHGYWKFFWPNGNLKSEGNYANGKEDGIFREYDKGGNLLKQTTYSKGNVVKTSD